MSSMSMTKAIAVPSCDTLQHVVLSMTAWLTLEQACIPSIEHQATHGDNLLGDALVPCAIKTAPFVSI